MSPPHTPHNSISSQPECECKMRKMKIIFQRNQKLSYSYFHFPFKYREGKFIKIILFPSEWENAENLKYMLSWLGWGMKVLLFGSVDRLSVIPSHYPLASEQILFLIKLNLYNKES